MEADRQSAATMGAPLASRGRAQFKAGRSWLAGWLPRGRTKRIMGYGESISCAFVAARGQVGAKFGWRLRRPTGQLAGAPAPSGRLKGPPSQ